MHHIVEWVFFEVPLRHFSSEADQRFQVHISKFEQVVELENLIHQELQTRLIQDLVKMEGVE